jgi:uncharacterized protein (TIGR02271 family)
MIGHEQINQVMGSNAVDSDGDKIGKVGQVYLDDQTGEPAWATVNTGLFGTSESFVPLSDASWSGDTLQVMHSKSKVKDAPRVATDGHISPEEEAELYRYYGIGSGTGVQTETTTATTGTTGTTEGYDTSGPTTDDAMTRSEEHLRAGTETREAGRARLRKYVVTEQESVTVPVSREEVRVEREPITDANVGDAMAGPAISEEEHEVVLREERPVVEKEAVPVERVRLGTETVTDTEQVSGEVRKEVIDVDADAETTARGRRD